MRLRATRLSAIAHAVRRAFALPLDALPPPAAAYSTRRLRSAYTGPALRVRRSLDNAETDIGFTGNDLDTAALMSFVGSQNLLSFSEEFNNAAWTKVAAGTGSAPVVTANAGEAPDGTTTADQIVFALNGGATTTDQSLVRQLVAPNAQNTLSVWMRTLSGTAVIQICTNLTTALATVTTTWQRFSITSAGSADTTLWFGLRGAQGTSDSATLLAWGAQLNLGATAQTYSPTSRRNRLTFSESVGNAIWTKANTLVTTGLTDPTGQSNAVKISVNTNSAEHRIDQTPVSAAGVQTYSIYVKAAEANLVFIRIGLLGGRVNLLTGEVYDVTGGATVSCGPADANGWRRLTCTVDAAANTIVRLNILGAGNLVSFAGDNVYGVLVWGGQLELGSTATTYQRVDAAWSATRDGNGFVPTWYDQSGNARHMTQATAANQPSIVSLGAINTQNDRPAPLFGTALSLATATGFGSAAQRSVISVNTYSQATAAYQYVWQQNSQAGTAGSGFLARSLSFGDWVAGDIVAFGDGFSAGRAPRFISNGRAASTALDIYTVSLGNTENAIRINGAAQPSRVTAAGAFPASATPFGISRTSGVQGLIGQVAELVYIDGALSDGDRQALERSQGAYFGITVS